jgi:T5SS/PEP-CTERM-associated repeat protein
LYTWTGKISNSFSQAGNWYNDTLGTTATAAPGISDEALIVASGSLQGPGAVYELGLTGTGSGLAIGGSLNGSYVFVGGNVTLGSGAELSSGNLIDIGDGSSTTIAERIPTLLTVSAGATLYAGSTQIGALDIDVGELGGNGTLAVTGAKAIASAGTDGIWVGDAGFGVVTVSAGAQLYAGGLTGQEVGEIGIALGTTSSAGTGTGSLVVTGSGSEAYFGDVVDVGYGGTGALSISAGASFYAGDEQTSLNIGDNTQGSVGAVTISAATAVLYGVVEDGAYGHGSFTISNGATVTATTNVTSGTPAEWSFLIGAAQSGNGTLAVASGAALITSHGLAVGSVGDGTLTVSSADLVIEQAAGAQLTALAIGLGTGTTGVVDVTGGLIYDRQYAGIIVGAYGVGTLAISTAASQGGTVVTGNPAGIGLTVGSASGASGTVTVTGAGSALYVDGTVLDGASGAGTIGISGGATFTAGASETLTALSIGGAGGPGALSLSSGAVGDVLGQASVGAAAAGSLSVSGGSHLFIGASGQSALVVGVQAGIAGSVLVTDAGTAFTLDGGLTVGNDGSGVFTIENTAQLTLENEPGEVSPGIVVAAGSGSTGTLNIESGATISAATGVAIGSYGSGLLTVAGGTLTIATAAGQNLSALSAGLSAGASGTIDIAGGLVRDLDLAGVVLGASGTATLAITESSGGVGGTLIAGDPTGSSGLALAIGAGATASVTVSGAASVLNIDGTISDAAAGKGSITLSAGAQLIAGFAATATALAAGGVGGTGSFVLSSGATATMLGQTEIGLYGTGSLAISGGSSFSALASGFEALVFASGSASSATGLITGAATSVQLTGGLEVGDFGNAQVTLSGGATLNATTTSGNGFPSVVIAAGAGAGALTVTGAGTKLTAAGQFEVGGTLTTGTASLLISSGATVTVVQAQGQSIEGATIGGASGAPASVATVTGVGSLWSIAGGLEVGASGGAAVLNVADGAHFSAAAVLVDPLGRGSLGTVTVTGGGSRLAAGTFALGGGGSTGALKIGAGAAVTVTGAASIAGNVSLAGGNFSIGSTLTVNAGSTILGSGTLSGGAIVDLGKIGVTTGSLSCLGPITGTGLLSIGGGGTLQLTKSEAKTVGIAFGAGGGTLAAATSTDLLGNIGGWSQGDVIALTALNVISDSYANGTLTLLGSNNATLGTLRVSGAFSTGNFTLSHPTASETLIAYHS